MPARWASALDAPTWREAYLGSIWGDVDTHPCAALEDLPATPGGIRIFDNLQNEWICDGFEVVRADRSRLFARKIPKFIIKHASLARRPLN